MSRYTPERRAWRNAISRCHNSRNESFRNYGGRGIRVCKAWRDSFEAFLADVGPKPGPEYSLDRKDNNGDYEPGNCRWATKREQAHNRRPYAETMPRYVAHKRSFEEFADRLDKQAAQEQAAKQRAEEQILAELIGKGKE